MLRRLQTFFVLAACVVSIPAAAEEPADNGASKEAPPPAGEPPASAPSPAPPPPIMPKAPERPEWFRDWQTVVTGYFRTPLAFGVSSRPGPDNAKGPASMQVSYGPNRTIDPNYYAFTYTRLQEQDWAEVFIHEKHKHVDAAVGWMGYWYQAVGFRNPDAAWAPGLAYIKLDTDFTVASLKPNIALQMGAWWPAFGYFEKYDTYTLGRFRQMGEQLKLTVPFDPDLTLTLVQGFGTNRDGSFQYLAPPFYGATVGLDLITYENVRLTYSKYLDIGVHYNNEWTSDPNLTQQTTMGSGKGYSDLSQAHLSVVGAEANVSMPYVGRLWVSPSYINVKNGWALANGGTEVMHSLGGAGIATNYMGWTNTVTSSTGSGSMFNLGFLYENTLSGIRGKPAGSALPEVTLNVFGLLADASLDLPPMMPNPANPPPPNSLKEFKYGADVTVQALDWLAFMLRYDSVNLDLDHPAYIFNIITPRIVFSSHFLSGETIYVQYSRYAYGDKMVLAGTWPWGSALVPGYDNLQAGPYAHQKPDEDVFKLQATIGF